MGSWPAASVSVIGADVASLIRRHGAQLSPITGPIDLSDFSGAGGNFHTWFKYGNDCSEDHEKFYGTAKTVKHIALERAVIAGLTTDAAVRAQCHRILAPMLACQLCKGLAYPANGVVMGGLDWQFATFGIWAGSALCIGLVASAPQPPSLATIWVGLSLFMGSQSLLSIARVVSRTGPWGMLYRGDQEKEK